jgi:drug/metabolite transporter (DMT)-like permease
MFPLFIPIALIIGGGVAYHLALRAASGASAWAVLTPAYGLAFLVSAALWARGGKITAVPTRGVLLVAGVLALSLLAIEGGYLLAYRSGWAMSNATALTNTAVVGALAMVGVLVLGESISGARAIGLIIAAAGVWLAVRAEHA